MVLGLCGVAEGEVNVMATFVVLSKMRPDSDAAAVRSNMQDAVNFFVKWDLPQGVSIVNIYSAADFRLVIGVYEADSHEGLAVMAAQWRPWFDSEVIPVVAEPEAAIGAMVQAGLIQAP
jgi:hypothetical protein